MKKTLLLFALLLFCIQGAFSKQLTSSEAQTIATSFYRNKQASSIRTASSPISSTTLKLVYSCTDSSVKTRTSGSTSNVYYYIFNVGTNGGFVIVSGDDRAKPILGYTDSGSFSADNMPDNFKNWMSFYQRELKALAAIAEDTIAIANSVSTTSTPVTTKASTFATYINPLLGTIAWDQSAPYNIFCPKIGTEKAPTGCVATAMAQIMKYYQWPVKGAGTHSYRPAQLSKPLTVDFSKTTYSWTNMLNTYGTSTAIQDTAVATLMYHCGVAVNMDYTAASSGAYSNDIPAALSNYFGYDPNAQLVTRDYYTQAEWTNLIKTELNSARPILYGGSSADGGHQFICDGYNSANLFHFNWGWSGSYNGYFELTSLNVETPGIGGGSGGFTEGQDMVIGIQKPSQTSTASYEIDLINIMQASVSNVGRNLTFGVNYGYANYGAKTFNGAIALGLYQGTTQVSILKQYDITGLESYYGNDSFTASGVIIPSSVNDGTYQLYSIYKATDQSTWSIMRNKVGTPNSLNVTVTSTNITFATPDVYPKLTLTEAVKTIGNLYNTKAGRFSATIKNSGGEFNSYISAVLTSTNGLLTQQITHVPVTIPSGETKTIELTGDVNLTPGSYILTLKYDTNNDQGNESMILLTPGTDNSVSVAVLSAPTLAPVLSLSQNILLASSTITNGSALELTAKIKNTGGYFNESLIAFIFPSTGGSNVDYMGPVNVILDTNEEKTITFNKNIYLDAAAYSIVLYYHNNSWTKFTPTTSGKIPFYVTTATGIENAATDQLNIYPNPATDVLYIQSPSLVKSVQVMDMSGKLLIKQEPQITGDVQVSVNELSQGVYFVKIETEEGTYTKKFFKK